MEQKKKNVMLTCLSLVGWRKSTYFYEYKDKGEYWSLEGYNTNEAPIKRVIEILYREGHGERLDRVVMICSKKARNPIGAVPEGSAANCAADFARIYDETSGKNASNRAPVKNISDGASVENASTKPLSEITHTEYYKELFQNFAETVDESYKEHRIEFKEVEVNDFLNEKEIALAVTSSASLVMGAEDESINLYVDYNGGPRIVTALELILCNLMKMRKKVNLREMIYMDFDNIQNIEDEDGNLREVRRISNMNEISECMDLVSGINEYVNYGRTRTLKEYFRDCRSERIQNILGQLECFANNMQMCLTDYIIANKESVRSALEKWQKEYWQTGRGDHDESASHWSGSDEPGQQSTGVYELMFSFVAEDILECCRPLLEGTVPRMVKWCVEKGFIWQAMILYEHEMPQYFREEGILAPTEEGWSDYLNWLEEQLEEASTEKSADEKRFNAQKDDRKYTSYYWLNSYLAARYEKNAVCRPDLLTISEKVERIMGALNCDDKKAGSLLDEKTLFEILTEYFEIQSQCRTPECRVLELGDRGELWDYDTMEKKLTNAVKHFDEE
ncbi:MAG: hypothetical protein LUI87_13440 [Lachnospiraceae bacterium]|nr:hypothetical protein [Lachnospiraceae bacterium]